MENLELAMAVYTALDNRASDLRSKNVGELHVKAGELQRAVDAPGRVLEVYALLQDDSLLSRAALELKGRQGPPAAVNTIFHYKVHGVISAT